MRGQLLQLFQEQDHLGFLHEFRRQNGAKGGAVYLWQMLALEAGTLGEPLEESEEPEDLNSDPVDYVDVWTHPDALDRGWITKRWEDL